MPRRQAVPLGPRSYQVIVVLAAMFVLLAFGWVAPSIAGLLAATAMVLLGQSGAADVIARRLIDVVGSGRPYLLMLALFLLTGVPGQVISNTATVLIIVRAEIAGTRDDAGHAADRGSARRAGQRD